MNIFVAGGHGKIGLRLLRLAAQRGDQARGLIRDPGQSADLEAAGASRSSPTGRPATTSAIGRRRRRRRLRRRRRPGHGRSASARSTTAARSS